MIQVKLQNKMLCVQLGKINGITWQKYAFSGNICVPRMMQWCWMTKCSRHAVQRRRMHDLQL